MTLPALRSSTLPVLTITIADAESFTEAGAMLMRLKAYRQQLEADHAGSIGAALHAHRQALALYRKQDEKPAELEAQIKAAMADFHAQQKQLRLAAERAAAAEERTRDAERPSAAPRVPAPVVAPPVPKAQGVSFRQGFDYALVEPKGVRPLYCSPDPVKIAAAVKSLGLDAVDAVGGIRVWPTTGTAVRTK